MANSWATRWELPGAHCRVRTGCCRVRTAGYAVQGTHRLLQGTHCRVRSAGYAPVAAGYALPGTRCRVRTVTAGYAPVYLGCRVHAGGASGRPLRRLPSRESIFKFCHGKLRKKFQNLDLEPDSTRNSLQSTRWVCEGGTEARGCSGSPPWERPWEPAWGGCPAAAGHLSRLCRGHPVALVVAGCSSLWPFGRESIFKFSHSKWQKKFQNLDLEPDSTRKPLQ